MRTVRISKNSQEIKTNEEWLQIAPPEGGKKQWVPFYSACELADYFINSHGKLPKEIDKCLTNINVEDSHFEAEPEKITPFDEEVYGVGGPRHHDLLMVGDTTVVGIEAKASEPLDKPVTKYKLDTENHKKRYENLCKEVLGKEFNDCKDIMYQLLSATAGTIVDAANHPNIKKAVLIVLLFVSKNSEKNIEKTRKSVEAFKEALKDNRLKDNGAFTINGKTFNPDIDFYVEFITVPVSSYKEVLCDTIDVQATKKIFAEYKNGNFQAAKRETNYFEVSGYPHYENVVSNILRFLLDTKEEHCFGDMWLKALLSVYNSKNPNSVIDVNGNITTNIEREYSNGSDKRIDLLIDCDNFLVVIENKIYADLNNDLSLYTKMAKKYKENVPILKIVLSLKPVNNPIIKRCEYTNITYDELLDNLNIDSIDQNTKWGMFNKEFIDNLRNMRGAKSMKLDSKWIEFMEDNKHVVNSLLEAKSEDTKKRLDFLRLINSNLDNTELSNMDKGVYNYSSSTYISQFVNIKLPNSDKTLCVETYIMVIPTGKDYEKYSTLYISLWCRRDKQYEGFTKILSDINKTDAKKHRTNGWGEHYILNEYDLTEEVDATKIVNKIVEYVVNIREAIKQ